MSFFEIFQPGLKYLREEKDRQKMLVAQPSYGRKGPLGIDLEGGKATFTMPAPSDSPQSEASQSEASQSDQQGSSPAESGPAESSPAESSPAESSPADGSPAESGPAEFDHGADPA
jgi:hypothetical protein